MSGQVDGFLKVTRRKASAVVYTVLGSIWALSALFSVNSSLRNLAALGIAVPTLLLIARMLQVQREFLDVSPILSPGAPGQRTISDRIVTVLIIGVFAAIVALSLGLWAIGRVEWIIPAAAIVFIIHFYLLPSDLSLWEDVVLASVALFAVILTPIWYPDQAWIWAVVASSACALACWLAAELRYQRILAAQ